MKTLQTKFDLLTLKLPFGEGCGQKRKTRHEEGRKGQRYHYQCVFLGNTHLAITIFKGRANFHLSFQADWLLREYLDVMMQLGAVGVGRGCGLELFRY